MPAARAAIAAGAPESQASIIASPNTASRTTPHHIGRTMTPHDAWATAPPSVSASSRRTMNPPMTSTTPSTAAAHINERPTEAAVRHRDRERAIATAKQITASTGSSHARTPTARAMAIVVSANAWSPIDANVTDTSVDTGARSGATTARAPVTTAPASARRRAIESDVALGENPVGRLDGGPRRPGQQVTAGDSCRHRLDERPDRHEVRVLAHELVGDRRAELGGDVVVAADLVDVVGERRAVEDLSIEVAGEQPEGGEDRAEDDQDPHDKDRITSSSRGSARHAVVGSDASDERQRRDVRARSTAWSGTS